MKIKALVSFSGAFSMYKGEERECSDKATLQDLFKAKYIEEVKESQEPPKDKEPPKDNKPPKGDKSSKTKTQDIIKGVKVNESK